MVNRHRNHSVIIIFSVGDHEALDAPGAPWRRWKEEVVEMFWSQRLTSRLIDVEIAYI